MSSASYAPEEPGAIISAEVTWLQGAFLSSLLCGVQITLSVVSFFAVLRQRLRRRLRIALLVYVFLLCAIMTAGQQTSLLFVQMGFIQSREYPGGPNAFLSDQYTEPVDLASTSLFVIANLMMESLLVWRCKVVCCTGDQPVWVGVVIPPVLLVAEYVTGILFLREMLRGGYTINYALVYSGLSLLLNITVTAIIAGRLLLHRRRLVRQFGPASLYTGFVILVIIFFSVGASMSNILQQTIGQVESIASLLIIYRIAQGKGWNDDVVVSSLDWRGDTEAPLEHELALETVANPALVRALSISSKQQETPISTSESPMNSTLPRDDGAV